MIIHSDFECGNIKLINQQGDTVFLQNDMRDTQGDWFYWAFCVEGAQGRTVTFDLDNDRLGYFGPAVSHDLVNWSWLDSKNSARSFTYTFSENEDKVYFAHNLLYTPKRLFGFFGEQGLDPLVLCESKRGRKVPLIRLGNGKKNVVITSRHHACESTGTYVLEGFLREFKAEPCDEINLFVVPFVDCDGVFDGDQGKNRFPHDHNRDYISVPYHPEVAQIKRFIEENGLFLGLDLHSPYHCGGRNDHIFFVRNNESKIPRYEALGAIFKAECGDDTMRYEGLWDVPPNTEWNSDLSPTFAATNNKRQECVLAFTLETTYFGTENDKVSAQKLINTGRAYCRAIKKYIGMISR